MSYDFEVDSSQYGLIDPPSSGYPAAYGWSVSAWFNLESLVSFENVVSLMGANDGNVHCHMRVTSGNVLELNRRGTAGNWVTITSGVTLSTGTWYLATYAETSRTSRKFWVNGTEATTNTNDLFNDWVTNNDLSRIGIACEAARVADGGPYRFLDGKVAEVAIWPSAVLTQANVDSLYGGALASSVAGGPSLWWRFNSDKGSSTYAADSGTATLTLNNGPIYSATHPTISEGSTIVPKSTRFTMLGIG